MDKRLLKLMELEILQELGEGIETGNEEEESGGGIGIRDFYLPKPPVEEYNSIMGRLRGLVFSWPKFLR